MKLSQEMVFVYNKNRALAQSEQSNQVKAEIKQITGLLYENAKKGKEKLSLGNIARISPETINYFENEDFIVTISGDSLNIRLPIS